jgi:SAM-dependent methyltransferase
MDIWMPRLACPLCRLAIAAGDGPRASCGRCGYVMEARGGILRGLTPGALEALEPVLEQYRRVRTREGYRPHDATYYRMLPNVARSDPQAARWRVRRESYAHLLRHAIPPGGPARVLDLGAGNGWLSHRLTLVGHRAVAVDQLDDDRDGLGVCRMYLVPFAVVQADFARLPFEPAQFDVAVFDGSLHYAPDPAAALAEARRMLVERGVLVVMDSPMFADARDGEAMVRDERQRLEREHGLNGVIRPGAGYLTFEALDRIASSLSLSGRFIASRGPFRWRLGRRLARHAIGRQPAAFGVWVAR